MAVQRTFSHTQGWVEALSILVIEISVQGALVNHGKFDEFIPVGFFGTVRAMPNGWMSVRISADSHDGIIVSTAYLPAWRVVQVLAVT